MTTNLVIVLTNFIVGLVLPPCLTALLARIDAPDKVRSYLSFALSALQGAVVTVIVAPGVSWQTYLVAIGVAWVGSMRGQFSGVDKPVLRMKENAALGIKTRQGRKKEEA